MQSSSKCVYITDFLFIHLYRALLDTLMSVQQRHVCHPFGSDHCPWPHMRLKAKFSLTHVWLSNEGFYLEMRDLLTDTVAHY